MTTCLRHNEGRAGQLAMDERGFVALGVLAEHLGVHQRAARDIAQTRETARSGAPPFILQRDGRGGWQVAASERHSVSVVQPARGNWPHEDGSGTESVSDGSATQ